MEGIVEKVCAKNDDSDDNDGALSSEQNAGRACTWKHSRVPKSCIYLLFAIAVVDLDISRFIRREKAHIERRANGKVHRRRLPSPIDKE